MGMISVEGLNFEYEGKRVLHDMSFDIAPGNITALVGPNGAGKTTLLRCLTRLETPLSGRISIDGLNVEDDPRGAHRVTGYLSDIFGLYDNLTVRRCLIYMAWAHGVRGVAVARRVDEVAERVGVTKYLEARAGTLSRGYRQRVGVGLALIHGPRVLLLDEPASGLDREARVELSHLVLALQAQGMTIVVSSHILAELEDYCTDMLVIREGRICEHISLKAHEAQAIVELEISLTVAADVHMAFIASREAITNAVATAERTVTCQFTGDEAAQARLLAELVTAGVPLCGFRVQRKTLQSAYMDIANATAKGDAA